MSRVLSDVIFDLSNFNGTEEDFLGTFFEFDEDEITDNPYTLKTDIDELFSNEILEQYTKLSYDPAIDTLGSYLTKFKTQFIFKENYGSTETYFFNTSDVVSEDDITQEEEIESAVTNLEMMLPIFQGYGVGNSCTISDSKVCILGIEHKVDVPWSLYKAFATLGIKTTIQDVTLGTGTAYFESATIESNNNEIIITVFKHYNIGNERGERVPSISELDEKSQKCLHQAANDFNEVVERYSSAISYWEKNRTPFINKIYFLHELIRLLNNENIDKVYYEDTSEMNDDQESNCSTLDILRPGGSEIYWLSGISFDLENFNGEPEDFIDLFFQRVENDFSEVLRLKKLPATDLFNQEVLQQYCKIPLEQKSCEELLSEILLKASEQLKELDHDHNLTLDDLNNDIRAYNRGGDDSEAEPEEDGKNIYLEEVYCEYNFPIALFSIFASLGVVPKIENTINLSRLEAGVIAINDFSITLDNENSTSFEIAYSEIYDLRVEEYFKKAVQAHNNLLSKLEDFDEYKEEYSGSYGLIEDLFLRQLIKKYFNSNEKEALLRIVSL